MSKLAIWEPRKPRKRFRAFRVFHLHLYVRWKLGTFENLGNLENGSELSDLTKVSEFSMCTYRSDGKLGTEKLGDFGNIFIWKKLLLLFTYCPHPHRTRKTHTHTHTYSGVESVCISFCIPICISQANLCLTKGWCLEYKLNLKVFFS